MARDDNGAGIVIVAFVLGAVTGAAVALLMRAGDRRGARRILAEKAREGGRKAARRARQGRELWDRQRENISTANSSNEARKAYEQARGAQPRGRRQGSGCERRSPRYSGGRRGHDDHGARADRRDRVPGAGALQVRELMATVQNDIRP